MTNERRKQIRNVRKKKNRNKNRIFKIFKKMKTWKKILLIASILVLILVIGVYFIVAWKFSKLNIEEIKKEEIIINNFEEEEVGVGYTNFVLFGGDSRSGEVEKNLNTDSIIIVSLNNSTKEIKMVSVYRDTLLDVGKGSIRKCNSAYSAGGATQAINMLNQNLDLNIQQYVTVDFGAVSDVIDMLGGIEVNVSEAEYKAVNAYIDETAMVAGKKAKHLTHAGVQMLDGVQATTYARIRKGVGDDYARTERQRLIIQLAAEKAMKADLATLNRIIDGVFPKVSTNLSMTDVLKYAKDVAKYKIGETAGFPFEKGSGNVPGRGSSVFPITLKKNVTMLHEFLYGTEEYQPSAKVVSISGEIAYIIGNRQVEPNTSWQDNGTNSSGTNSDGTNSGGDTTNQGGDTTNQGGDTTNPGGDTTNPDGDTTTPGGDTTNPDGDTTNPGGDATTPDGDGGSSGGDTVPSDGGGMAMSQ